MSNKRLVPLNLVALASAPTGGMRTGDLYFNTEESKVYVYDGEAWIVATGSGGGASINSGATAPEDPSEGDAWFNTTEGRLYVFYDSFWIEVGANGGAIGPQGPAGPQGESGVVSATSPIQYNASTKTVSIDQTLLTIAQSQVTNLTTDLGNKASATDLSTHTSATTNVHGITNTANLVYTNDSRLTDARTPTAHKSSHATGGSDALSPSDIGAAPATGISPSAITGTAVVDSDARLSDARTPTAHATSHGSAGSDPITVAQSQVTNLTTDLAAKAPLNSPTFTGVPAAPTAAGGTNTTQIATTAFVRSEVTSLVNSAPSALDTLGELATALGNDANFATTTATALGNRVRVDAAQSLNSTQKAQARSNIDALSTGNGEVGTANIANGAVTNEKLANSGITINGSAVALGGSVTIDALPSQTGQSGKYLTTNGTSASWATLNVENTVVTYEYTATGSQTVFTGNDRNSIPLAFTSDKLLVFLNGVLLSPGDDFTIGTNTVTLVSGAAAGDELVVVAFSTFNVANTYTIAQADAEFATKAELTAELADLTAQLESVEALALLGL